MEFSSQATTKTQTAMVLNLDLFDERYLGATLVAIIISYYLVTTVHNLYFHPLKAYPGPQYAATSRLPITYVTITGKSAIWVNRLHEKYGPVVRVAPDELSYADARAWNDIYGALPGLSSGMKRDPGLFEQFEDEDNRPSFLTSPDDEHLRVRLAYAPAFSRRALGEQEPLFIKYADRAMDRLREMQGSPVDISRFFYHILFDMVGHLQYGESLGLLETGSHTAWADRQAAMAKFATILAALADIAWIRLIILYVLPPLTRPARRALFKTSNNLIDQRLSSRESHGSDLIGLAFRESRKERTDRFLNDRDIRANAHLIMLAGTETMSSLLAALTASLLSDSDGAALKRLIAEVRGAFDDSSSITFTSVSKLPYLAACIKESLRLHPPAPGALPRAAPDCGAMIAGRWVPGRTRVYVTILASTRFSANFYKPDSFCPERWMEGSSSAFASGSQSEFEYARDNRAAYQPFSFGQRNCIGQEMAQLVSRLIICKLLYNFNIEAVSDIHQWRADARVYTVWDYAPLLIRLIPVDHAAGGKE
ncbi:cytochrome P450 [Aspergillus stella-maris]|uniref:cytochrome P450 n=1 Tax=Aspergillus stella-maris TaxID=1810926 RepID=UPI003CCE317C